MENTLHFVPLIRPRKVQYYKNIVRTNTLQLCYTIQSKQPQTVGGTHVLY